jgi:DUF917 family protein
MIRTYCILLSQIRAKQTLRQGKRMKIVKHTSASFGPKDWVTGIGFMGAPTVVIEKLVGLVEGVTAVRKIESLTKVTTGILGTLLNLHCYHNTRI